MEGVQLNHLRDTSKMVETPRTDAAYFKKGATMYDLAGEMKRMERELNAANAQVDRLTAKVAQLYEGAEEQKQRIKRLEEAGDRMRLFCADPDDCFAWDKAKEAKL